MLHTDTFSAQIEPIRLFASLDITMLTTVTCSECTQPFHLNCIGPQFEKFRSCLNCSVVSSTADFDRLGVFQDIPELSLLTSQRGLKFLHLNVNSLLPKVDELRLLLLRYKDIDFFSITETHLSSNISDDEIGIPGYTIYRLDRQAQSKGGGVLVYVRNCVSVSRRYDLESKSIEGIWLEILITKSKNILFGSLYRPPISSQFISADFNAILEDTLSLAATENKEILLVGDLNANFLPRQCTDRISREVKDLLKGIGMSQLIKEPTRITEHSSSLIDVILSTHPHNIPVANVIPLGLSDHYMVGCVRKMNSLKFQARTIKCRNYAKYNKEAFNNDLRSASWDLVLTSSDVNIAWTNFKRVFLEICDRHVPLLTKKVRGSQNPWMTSAISNLMSTRDYCLRKAKRTGKDEDWSSYRLFRNKVTAAMRHTKSDYNRNLIQENLDNPRNFWKSMKKIFPTSHQMWTQLIN